MFLGPPATEDKLQPGGHDIHISEDRVMNRKRRTAKDIMTSNVLMVGEDWLIDRLAEFLVENSISGAPVVSGSGKLIGVVSLTDIARFNSLPVRDRGSTDLHEYYQPAVELQVAKEEMSGFRIEGEPLTTVRDIMTPVIFSVPEEASVQQVAETMIKGHIHRLFVTHDDQVVGIISAFDLLRVIRDFNSGESEESEES
jgi:CBS domain-containing protein